MKKFCKEFEFFKSSKMKNFYAWCFWITFIIFFVLLVVFVYLNKVELIKDIALPFAAGIFAFGQLWQQERQNEFERKDRNFERKNEIFFRLCDLNFLLIKEIAAVEMTDWKKYFDIEQEIMENIFPKACVLFTDKSHILLVALISSMSELKSNLVAEAKTYLLSDKASFSPELLHLVERNMNTKDKELYLELLPQIVEDYLKKDSKKCKWVQTSLENQIAKLNEVILSFKEEIKIVEKK